MTKANLPPLSSIKMVVLNWLKGNFVSPFKGVEAEWEIDTSHNPQHLDIIITKLDADYKDRMEFLIEFLTENKFVLYSKYNFTSRPQSTSDSEEQLVFTKSK